MDFDHENVRLAVNEDRLSSLPDELIHQIFSCIDDTKFVVQTCLLFPRWKLLWTTLPCLNFSFSTEQFRTLPKFSKFVTNVLSRRNHKVEVSSVKLSFHGAASQPFVRKIANYAFSHNVQELTIDSCPKHNHEFPPCLFSSKSLKDFTFRSPFFAPCLTPKRPWDFPALTTMHLSEIQLCDDNRESFDLFSKCVNLKNLTLEDFVAKANFVDIIAPRLSNLVVIKGIHFTGLNVKAPQLKNLTVVDCKIRFLNAPSGLSSLYYRGRRTLKLSSEDGFHSLNKATVNIRFNYVSEHYTEGNARDTIEILQQLHCARFLTLSLEIVECLSSYPELVAQHPSPFSNLICLDIDYNMRKDAYKVKMSAETKSFLLDNSPSATFVMDLPEEPPTKAMKAKEAREKKRAKLVAEIESCMLELQSSLKQENILAERKQTKEKTELSIENFMAQLRVLTEITIMQCEPEKKAIFEEAVARMKAQISSHLENMKDLAKQEFDHAIDIETKKVHVRILLESLPKRQRADMEARYSHQFEEIEVLTERLLSETASSRVIFSHNQSLLQQIFPDPPP